MQPAAAGRFSERGQCSGRVRRLATSGASGGHGEARGGLTSALISEPKRRQSRFWNRPTMKTTKLAKSYRIDDGKHFRLKDFDPADTGHWKSIDEAKERVQEDIERMRKLQDKLYAQDCWSVLLIIQAMDAAGKDGTIKHVMSGVNPEGVQVYSFKQPSSRELQHDFLWRTTQDLPERGHIGIFNRSYYEEVLIARVHPGILRSEGIPDAPHDDKAIPDYALPSVTKHLVAGH